MVTLTPVGLCKTTGLGGVGVGGEIKMLDSSPLTPHSGLTALVKAQPCSKVCFPIREHQRSDSR